MSQSRLLLCTDMDRTIIPNGSQAEHPNARQCFADFCLHPEVTLVYVTGRHQALVQEAIIEYALPEPDFVITDVGTKIYQVKEARWLPWQNWEQEIAQDWQGKNHNDLMQLFANIGALELQEDSKQNTHKLSYYLNLQFDHQAIIGAMEALLKTEGICASLIWSIDEATNMGLLDVLPRHATKLHAIEFLQQQLAFGQDEILFAGDSGNDLPVLISQLPSVLVANASDDIKQSAQQQAEQQGNATMLYLAQDSELAMNGNYTAGVLAGVQHFYPEFYAQMEQD
ncbi:MAG: HAD-IIB family hydrolase [Methylococcaceae bacterium]|nr:HAD-IIB family hydrolase [Methylococcaceae bacterium]